MSVTDYIDQNKNRNVESYIANASFGAAGTKYVDVTSAVNYDYVGILVCTDCTVSDVSGFHAKHTGWANDDVLLAAVGYYPISGSNITLSAGTCILIQG